MEYLDQSDGIYDPDTGKILIKVEARGTRYDGRTELIENIEVGQKVVLVREPDNIYNSNNFGIVTPDGRNVGNLPAELCNVLAPLVDKGIVIITDSFVSFTDPVTKRSRHAKQAVLFVEIHGVM